MSESKFLRSFRSLVATGSLLLAWPAAGADSLAWRKEQSRVDADVSSWNVFQVLERVAAATGWKVFIDPQSADRRFNTRFKDRPIDKALDLLLGDLNRVLLPPTNGGAPRLLVFRTSEREATHAVKAKDEKKFKHIPNELIVQLKPGANIDELAKKLGAKIVGRADDLNTYRLQFESEDAANTARDELRRNEDVASVDLNYPVDRDPQTLSASGNPLLNLDPKADPNCDQIIVGLIDTALHPAGNPIDPFLLPSISVAGDAKLAENLPSHGDAMAQSALQGTAATLRARTGTRVRVLPVDVYGGNVSTTTFEVAKGVYEAINKGAMIVNMSLGSPGGTSMLEQVIKRGHDQGVVFFGAAGNEPVQTPTYPAAYPEVIAVTAGDAKGQIAPYANRGEFVDVIAPGDTTIQFGNQAWRVAGTSAATAIASGQAAGFAQQNFPCAGAGMSKTELRDFWRRVDTSMRRGLAVQPGAKPSAGQ